jgi:hypothetical protein
MIREICLVRNIEMTLFTFELFFLYPTRLFSIFVCYMIDLNSKLLKTDAEDPRNTLKILRITQATCKLFNSYAFVFVFIQHLYVLTYTFGIFSYLAAKLLTPNYDFNFIGFTLQIVLLNLETFNLAMFMRSCKVFKKKVRQNSEES